LARQVVENGDTDLDAIDAAIKAAQAVTDKPSLLKVRTTIGYGSPNKAGTQGIHTRLLGMLVARKSGLGMNPLWCQKMLCHWRKAIERGAK